MERKIYFCGSIRGGTQDSVLYERLIQLLKNYGRVLTEPVFITKPGEKGKVYEEGHRIRCCMKD